MRWLTSGNSSFCDCVPYFVDRIRRNRVLTHLIYELYLKKHIRHRNVPLYRMCFGHKIFKLYKLMGTFCSQLYLSCVLSYALSSTIIPVIMCNFNIRCTKKLGEQFLKMFSELMIILVFCICSLLHTRTFWESTQR